METFSGHDDGRSSKKLITDTENNKEHPLVSCDDVLIDILLRLPVISLHLFKSVSKRWLSLITSPSFITLWYQKTNLDPPSGLLLRIPKTIKPGYGYNLLSLDTRVSAKGYLLHNTFSKVRGDFRMLQSCNGLLLCRIIGPSDRFYVYNPSINMIKMLPENSMDTNGRMRMAFDPSKSRHYKVVYAECIGSINSDIHIQLYSSETGIWSVCGDRFPYQRFECFQDGIYCNDAIHWLNTPMNGRPSHFKLNVAEHEHPVLVNIETPVSADGKAYRDCKLFESLGCLLLLCRDPIHCRRFCIYEMNSRFPVWSVKYRVNLDAMIKPYLKTRRMPIDWGCSSVWCIVLGEREEDSFLVMELYGTVVQYKIVTETFSIISVFGSVRPYDYFQFIPSFASV